MRSARSSAVDTAGTRVTQTAAGPFAAPAARADALQYVRALAALVVVFYHQTVYLSRIGGDPRLHDLFGVRPGLYGVVAFFVLSGYLMADIAPKYRPVTFIVHRVIRIYPTYWFCVLAAALFFHWLWTATLPNADYVPDIGTMLLADGLSRDLLRLVLAPAVFADFPLGVEWTLLYETTFYLIIFAVSLSGLLRFLPHLAVLWLGLVVWAMWTNPAGQGALTTPSLLTLPFFGINAAFVFGILGARARHYVRPLPALLAGVLLLAMLEVAPHRLNLVQAAAGLACLVMGLLALERSGRLPQLLPLRRLGDWSYAIYLVHVPVILGTFKLMPGASAWITMGTSLALVLLTSALIGSVDVAAYYRLKRALDAAPAALRIGLAGTFVLAFLAAALYGLRSG